MSHPSSQDRSPQGNSALFHCGVPNRIVALLESHPSSGCSWSLYLDKFSYQLGKKMDDHHKLKSEHTTDRLNKADRLEDAKAKYSAGVQQQILAASAQAHQRFLSQMKSQHGTSYRTVRLVNSSRLMLHLGRSSVLENVGLYTERTSGLPVIPGTAVKGVVSTWACWEMNGTASHSPDKALPMNPKRQDLALRILGDNAEAGSQSSGEVIFLGGFPETVPSLEMDLVNPHTDVKGNPTTPAPSAFLSVAPDTVWVFPFIARPGAKDPVSLLEMTEKWLVEALTQYGVGAKVSAGYGAFRAVKDQDDKRTKAKMEELQKITHEAAQATAIRLQRQAQSEQAAAAIRSDFNETIFENVLKLIPQKGRWGELQKMVEKMKNPGNEEWLAKFKGHTASKDHKELRNKEWYPK